MSFSFSAGKDFAANLEAYLQHMEAIDPEMGKILRANSGQIAKLGDEVQRRTGRAMLAATLESELDALVSRGKK